VRFIAPVRPDVPGASSRPVADWSARRSRPSSSISQDLFDVARTSARKKNETDPDYWSLVAEPELRLYEAIANGSLPKQIAAIERSFRDVFQTIAGRDATELGVRHGAFRPRPVHRARETRGREGSACRARADRAARHAEAAGDVVINACSIF
jgi:hypothetical protein